MEGSAGRLLARASDSTDGRLRSGIVVRCTTFPAQAVTQAVEPCPEVWTGMTDRTHQRLAAEIGRIGHRDNRMIRVR